MVDGWILWANMHLLFWLSLIPFVTDWVGENHLSPYPVALYGVVLFMAALAYWLLTRALLSVHGANTTLAKALKKDKKERVSLFLYLLGIMLSFVNQWLGYSIFIFVAILWFIPDRRIEHVISKEQSVR